MPEPLFILCPGRSFSSVICAVIGQHPQCYGVPELNLFIGDTLGLAVDRFQRTGRLGMYGLARTLAQLHHGEQTFDTVKAAYAWIEDNRALTPREVMNHIQDRVGHDRILVEKSPSNVISSDCLARILQDYPTASYLQLLRHPRSRGKSHQAASEAEKARAFFNKVTGIVIDYEAKWTGTHQMIHMVGREMPPGQMLRLHGETVLRDLRLYLPQICEWLDIRSDDAAIEAMLHPEDSPYSCIGPENAKYGTNPGFLENPHLDMDKLSRLTPPTLDAPMDWDPTRHFSDTTRALAQYYGYI